MSLYLMLTIMLFSGIFGGLINYYASDNFTNNNYIRGYWKCAIVGLGATLVLPLFLKIADSKLMDDIRFEWKPSATKTLQKDTLNLNIENIIKLKATTDSLKLVQIKTALGESKRTTDSQYLFGDQGKNYLLWIAYCIIAASAGYKFIDKVIKGVLNSDKVATLQQENIVMQKTLTSKTKQNQANQKADEQKALTEPALNTTLNNEKQNISLKQISQIPILLPPITVPNDPQKGRFGGSAKNKNRVLEATISEGFLPGFYKLNILVKSLDVNEPLIDDVIFYLHDSFSPSVRRIEVVNNIAIIENLIAYGAFTVGAVVDNGATLLELDLALENTFPQQFRDR